MGGDEKIENEKGIEKEHEIVVERDDAKDIKFTGVLLASTTNKDNISSRWVDCAVYKTAGGSFVYSEISVTLWQNEHNTHSGEKFDSLGKLFKWLEGAEPFTGAAKALAHDAGFDMTEHID